MDKGLEFILKTEALTSLKRDGKAGSLKASYIFVCRDKYLRGQLIYAISAAVSGKGNSYFITEDFARLQDGELSSVSVFDGKMKVENAAQLLDDAYSGTLEGSQRIIFITEAQELSPQMQNKLLKLFEEPPKDTYIFFLCRGVQSFLKTITSRAGVINIGDAPVSVVKDILLERGVDGEQAEAILGVSGFSIEKAISCIDNQNLVTVTDGVFAALADLKNSKLLPEIASREIFNKENCTLALEISGQVFNEMLNVKSNLPCELFSEKSAAIDAIASRFSLLAIGEILYAHAEAERRLRANGGAPLVITYFLMAILEKSYLYPVNN
ncbi:MAG: hypothetical protein LBN25_04225 [Christensenellaceae bacterium]|jgi:hypothetical protein|nr:hypothetical protein [Christensenellaceae bacterium]